MLIESISTEQRQTIEKQVLWPWLERRADSHVILVLVLLSLTIFANSLGNQFVSDDHILIEFNQALRDWSYITRIFVESHAYDGPWANSSVAVTDYYRPFTRMLFALAYHAFGLKPFYWHLLNLTIFSAVVALSYTVVKQISSYRTVACAATLLFIVHPIHSEAVSWINCLVELLHAMFFLGSFALYLQSRRETGQRVYFVGSLALFVAALLSKEAALCFPILVGAYRFIFDEKTLLKRVLSGAKAAMPYLLVVAVYIAFRYFIYGGSLRMASRIPFWTVIFTVPSVVLEYFRMMILPVGLNTVHSIPLVNSPVSLRFLLPLLLLITGAVLVWKKGSRQFAFACVWIIITMLPVLNIGIFVTDLIIQDRYAFLPSLGFCAVAAMALNALLERDQMLQLRPAVIVVFAVVVIGLLVGTVRQNGFWYSDVTLFARAAEQNPESEFAQCSYGWALYREGNKDEAARYFTLGYKLKNGMSACSCVGMGSYYADQGDYNQAVQFYEQAVEMGEGDSNLLLFTDLARAYIQKGDSDKAIKLLNDVVAKHPNFQDARIMLGQLNSHKKAEKEE
jgi:protein O-mannosyl-transferase